MEDYLNTKARQLAELLEQHRGRVVVYTGAGISTSANIPDYRGLCGTQVNERRTSSDSESQSAPPPKRKRRSPGRLTPKKLKKIPRLRLPEATFATPTFTHMAIRTLVEHGYVRHVVSQNVDGLHMRSGLALDRLSEFHGNIFLEQCISCKLIVRRNFDVAETTARGQHLTGRICPLCNLRKPTVSKSVRDSLKLALQSATHDCSSSQTDGDYSSSLVFKQKRMVTKLVYESGGTTSRSHLPLLRDVIVHSHERQPLDGLTEIYKVDKVISALRGKTPRERTTIYDEPASLILVIGSSLQILRNYPFLWPRGLGGCLKAIPSSDGVGCQATHETPISPLSSPSTSDYAQCSLAIVNLQPTFKDGLAKLVCRVPCDDLMRITMYEYLHIGVLNYQAERDDPLYRGAIHLLSGEEYTRTRPNIPFDRL